MRQGFTIILILFAIVILMALVGWLGIDNFYTNKVLTEIKQDKVEIQKQLKICEEPAEPDMRIFWAGNDAFYLKECKMQKVKNVNELILLISKGFKH